MKNIIKYYIILLERWENAEAIDLLHLKIDREMKKVISV